MREWAARWGVSAMALADLRDRLTGEYDRVPREASSEAAVQNVVRMEASRKGIKLFRNNVGAMQDETGRVVRYGLANDSAAMNKVIKSADLVGIRPVLIEPGHVGTLIGQFVSREIKAAGWRYTGTPREVAQLAWAQLITANGGNAGFATGEGTL
jgi:hypothetical protein